MRKHIIGTLAATMAGAILAFALVACQPMVTATPAVDTTTPTPQSTKYSAFMVFDCQQTPNTTSKTFTASSLACAMDDAKSSLYGPYVKIAELDSTATTYVATDYLKLDITTGADGDTITTAALILMDGNGNQVRTISANGTIKYLGAEGFIYISAHSSAGYFFASSTHALGATVTYTYTKETVTLKSQLSF